jgi:hypothetical protein
MHGGAAHIVCIPDPDYRNVGDIGEDHRVVAFCANNTLFGSNKIERKRKKLKQTFFIGNVSIKLVN